MKRAHVLAAVVAGVDLKIAGQRNGGVRALAAEMKKRLGVEAIDLTEDLSHEV